MSTFALREAVHVCRGSKEFDFPAGGVTAANPDEEVALDHLVELEIATVTARSAPPVPEPEPEPEAPPSPVTDVAPPGSPGAPEPPVTDAAGIAPVHEEA